MWREDSWQCWCPNKDTDVTETLTVGNISLYCCGEAYDSGTASPQSHFTSMENVLNKVNSSQCYCTIWCCANRAISSHGSKAVCGFFLNPLRTQVVTGFFIRVHLRYLQVCSWIITQLERWKTHQRGRQTGYGVSVKKRAGGGRVEGRGQVGSWSLLASALNSNDLVLTHD